MTLSRLLLGNDRSSGADAARAWADGVASVTGAEVVVAQDLAGPAAPVLLALADEVDADLVVVGRRGAGGFGALVLGSTAHQVAEHATRPVAVIPAASRGSAKGWPFTTIAVGLDGSPAAAGAMSWAAPLAAESSARVVVVHALELGPAFAAAGLADGYEQARGRLAAEVEEWCAPLRDVGVAYSTVVEEGGPAGVLLDAVRTHDADLLVVGRRAQRPFPGIAMGSAAHRALGFASCPTVVVPATD
jgi:nucleotide-binding universal stress UspA family protein